MTRTSAYGQPAEAVENYLRHIHDIFFWDAGQNMTFVNIGRVFLVPIQVPFTLTIDTLGTIARNTGFNIRMAIYDDNGDTPVGGALLGETGIINVAATGKVEGAITSVQLTPGLYWLAIQGDDTLGQIYRHATDAYQGGTLLAYRFENAGGFAAFEDPCPATATDTTGPGTMYALVASVP